METNDAKLRFIAIAKLAAETDSALDWNVLSKELGVTRKTIRQWSDEINDLKDSENVLNLLDVDEAIVDRVAREVVEETAEAASGPRLHIHPISGKIEVLSEEAVATKEAKEAKVAAFKDSVAGLKALQAEVQGTAGTLASRILDLAEDETAPLSPRDLASLTTALCSIQQAFFNKPTTNIQVNTVNANGESTSLLSAFKGNQQA